MQDPDDVKSTDLKALLEELKMAEEVLSQMEQLKEGNPVENKMIVRIKKVEILTLCIIILSPGR